MEATVCMLSLQCPHCIAKVCDIQRRTHQRAERQEARTSDTHKDKRKKAKASRKFTLQNPRLVYKSTSCHARPSRGVSVL